MIIAVICEKIELYKTVLRVRQRRPSAASNHRVKILDLQLSHSDNIIIYSDGSKLSDSRAGAGSFISYSLEKQQSYYWHVNSTLEAYNRSNGRRCRILNTVLYSSIFFANYSDNHSQSISQISIVFNSSICYNCSFHLRP